MDDIRPQDKPKPLTDEYLSDIKQRKEYLMFGSIRRVDVNSLIAEVERLRSLINTK